MAQTNKIKNSIISILGIIIFSSSLIILFYNENQENFADYVSTATSYKQNQSYKDNQLVYMVGNLNTTTFAEDPYLYDTQSIYIKRIVEIYGYIEEQKVSRHKSRNYEYDYHLGWTSTPKKTFAFRGALYERPSNVPSDYNSWIDSMPENRENQVQDDILINDIKVSTANLEFNNPNNLSLDTEKVNSQNLLGNESIKNGKIYRENNPESNIGDVRIRFEVIQPLDEGILFGSVKNNQFSPFISNKGNLFYQFYHDIKEPTDVIDILDADYQKTLWTYRITGFILMFLSLILLASTLKKLLNYTFTFYISHLVYGIFALITSLFLTSLIIIIPMIYDVLYFNIGIVIVIMALPLGLMMRKKLRYEKHKKR